VASFRNDFRPVVRRLGRAPLFTFLTLLTLAIGIGANTAIFSIIDGVLLKPLPYPDPDRLVGVWHSAPGLGIPQLVSSPSTYLTYREQGRAFEDTGLWTTASITVTGKAEPEQVPSLVVTAGVLPILGATPAIGRGFTAHDDAPGSPLTVILTHGYWKDRFGGDTSVLGRTIMADSRPREVIGVLSSNFRFLDLKVSMVVPLQLEPSRVYLGNFSYVGIARLRRGVTLAQASADMARLIPLMPEKYAAPMGMSVRAFREARLTPNLRPLKQEVVGDVGSVLWVLMGTIGMVLLIACANVANLLLVRAEGRQQELAIRTALGARWTDLVRELMTESLILGLAGGIFGAGLAYGALRLLIAIGPGRLPRLTEISIDLPALLFTLGISILSGLIFGLIPAFKYARPRVGGLREGGRTSSQGRERHRTRAALAIVQIAIALVLLIGAGLMIRTFHALRQVQPGFTHPEQVQTLRISIPSAQVPDADRAARMHSDVVHAILAVPGVVSAGLSTAIPTDGNSWDPVYAEDRTYADGQMPPMRRFTFIAPDYFRTMGDPLLAGRDLTWADIYDRRPVAMLSDKLARDLWGSPAAAIGKRIRDNPKGVWREVVGVAGDERSDGADQPAPSTVYWPFRMDEFQGFTGRNKQMLRRSLFVVIRSNRTGTESFLRELRQAVWSVNSSLPLANVRTLSEIWDKSMARTSFTLVMLAIAGAMALLLGIVGIYGVIAYSVSQRTREIGIRMALGAQHGAVRSMFVRQGLVLASIGVACGLGVAAAVTRWINKMLFGVGAIDTVTYVAVAIVLLLCAALASYAPARRASRIEPADALRAE
jgi:putative ABC transport system permease protein